MAVLTRNEHCPPHVHVGSNEWQARFEFSFWHAGVRLMDMVPVHRQPTVAVLEDLRQALKTPAHLRRARECWYQAVQSVCLGHQLWDQDAGEVVAAQDQRPGARMIEAATFDAPRYRTILQLKGASRPVEIAL